MRAHRLTIGARPVGGPTGAGSGCL